MIENHILAFSNFLVFAPLIIAFRKIQIDDIIFLILISVSSFLMHLSETKHHLSPPHWRQYSNLFLNLDRMITIIAGVYYFCRLWYFPSDLRSTCFIIFSIGATCLGIGEIKTSDKFFNRTVYPCLHVTWHFCIYLILQHLVYHKMDVV